MKKSGSNNNSDETAKTLESEPKSGKEERRGEPAGELKKSTEVKKEKKGKEEEEEAEVEKKIKGKKKAGKPGKAVKKPEKVKPKEKDKKEKPKDDEAKPKKKLIRIGKDKGGRKGSGDSDAMSIDWETEDGDFETSFDKDQLKVSELEAEISVLQRENSNLYNEIIHMKPDLEKKTELIDTYAKRLKNFKGDFERYKIRTLKENKTKMKFASEKLILNILEVIDNMDRAITQSKPEDKTENIIEAITQMRKQMINILEKDGLKAISAAKKPFDPEFHEAMSQEKNDSYPDGTVIEELLKGYLYKEKVIRPTRVKVSQSDVNPAVKIEKPKKKEEKEKEKKEEKKEAKGEKKKDKKEKKEEKKEAKGERKKDKKEKKESKKEPKKEKVSEKKEKRGKKDLGVKKEPPVDKVKDKKGKDAEAGKEKRKKH